MGKRFAYSLIGYPKKKEIWERGFICMAGVKMNVHLAYRHIKINKPYLNFIIKNIFDSKINVRHLMGVLHSFSIKNIFMIK